MISCYTVIKAAAHIAAEHGSCSPVFFSQISYACIRLNTTFIRQYAQLTVGRALCNAAVRPSVSPSVYLSVCSMPPANNGAF